MTEHGATSPPAGAFINLDDIIRSVLFVGVLLVVWVSLEPFQSLSNPPAEYTTGGNPANQVAYTLIFVLLTSWAYVHGIQTLKPIFRPVMLATLAWFAICVLTSWEPALSARRLAFTLMVLAAAAILLLLPKNVRQFSDFLAAAVLIVLALCYLGVLLAPAVSIHQVSDFLEPEHAGSWRGLFPHKNEAGAVMVVFIMIGLFVARARGLVLGGSIVALSAVFLLFTHSKTPIALLPFTLIMSAIVTRMPRPAGAMAVVLGTVVVLNLLTVGSVYFAAVRELLDLVMPDSSFTGRSDIWKFALEQLGTHPITGFGFSAFWGTRNVVFGLGEIGTWATGATDAHNGYLNLALTIGVPGLLLVVAWMVVLPLLDFFRRPADPQSGWLSILFVRVWLFGLYSSCFESVLFPQVGEVWFVFLLAVFGLRYLAVSPVKA